MKKKSVLFVLSFLFQWSSVAAPLAERNLIKKMAGCYEVDFQFVETFPLTKGYKNKSPYYAKALEWVAVDVDAENRVDLQHILLIGRGHTLKHWRQEWIFEPSGQWRFMGDKTWDYQNYNSIKTGMWKQVVTQVDDSPRYECTAPWLSNGKDTFWECQTWAPLPRREFSKRSDYNVLDRRNRHVYTGYGWVHEQDNKKLKTKSGITQQTLVEEKGKNRYVKVDSQKCAAAQKWWSENKSIWKSIRMAWSQVRRQRQRLEFKKLKKPLWRDLFQLAEKAQRQKWSTSQIQSEAVMLIESTLK